MFSLLRRPFGIFSARSSPPGAAGDGFDGTERTWTRSDGRKQCRNSADGCGEGRACSICSAELLVLGAARKFRSASVSSAPISARGWLATCLSADTSHPNIEEHQLRWHSGRLAEPQISCTQLRGRSSRRSCKERPEHSLGAASAVAVPTCRLSLAVTTSRPQQKDGRSVWLFSGVADTVLVDAFAYNMSSSQDPSYPESHQKRCATWWDEPLLENGLSGLQGRRHIAGY